MRPTRIVPSLLLLLLLAAPVAPAAAQSPTTLAGDRALRVTADSATIVVTFTGAGTARLDAETPAGTFTLAADSVTFRAWAVAATQLDPPGRDSAGAPTYAGVALGDPSVGVRASLSRLAAELNGDYELLLTEGARRQTVRLRYVEWTALYLALLAEDPSQVAIQQGTVKTYFAFQVEQPVVPSASNRPPEYPPEMLAARRTGMLVAQWVVGVDGRPRMDTFRVLRSPDPAFDAAVRRAVAGWRFTPAQIGGKPVLQMVQMPFDFSP